MLATYGERAVFIDGRISTGITALAAESGNIKTFFNRRFHDKGVDWQRLVYFQTVSTKRWGKKKRGISNLHFHALMILPERQTLKQVRQKLELVFGKAGDMGGKIQFKITQPDWQAAYTFNEVTANGPLGKLLYVQQGMGGTYNDLQLNDSGKRSRKAPIERLRCNKKSRGLARGIPSNFNAKATLCDHVSTEAGRRAFVAWLKEAHEIQKEQKRRAVADDRRRRQEAMATGKRSVMGG
ncbi:hypothetical protein ACQKGL_29740 [Ensifer adhaerens]|uniref:hypothetical protein n=1 Tax=Ensifer adhaerens TaxID=106592 RepID=UPI003D08AD7E